MAKMSEEEFLKRKKERQTEKARLSVSEETPGVATAAVKNEASKTAENQEGKAQSEPKQSAPKAPKPSHSGKGKIIGIVAAILVIAGGAASWIVMNNAQIAEALTQVIQKEKEIANKYPECTKSSALRDGTNTNLYRINEDKTYEAQSNSVNDFQNYMKDLATLEQMCEGEKAQKEAEAKAEAEQKRLEEERARLEEEKHQALVQAAQAQAAAERAKAEALEAQKQREAAEEQAKLAEMNAQQGNDAVNNAGRLSPVNTVTFKGKNYVSWLIMYDNVLKTPCHVITNSKYPIMQSNRWCIPFSGNEADLSDTFAATVAMTYADRKICKTGSTKQPTNGQTRDTYCNQMFDDLQNQATREHWASLSEICKVSGDPKVKEYCGHLF